MKSKKATADYEINHLRTRIKQSSAIYAIVKVAAQYGLRSNEFAAAFDLQTTSLNLEPVAIVEWPSHVLMARRRLNSKKTENPDTFLSIISVQSLAAEGLNDKEIYAEEDQAMGERLAGWFKSASYEEMVQDMLPLFATDREWELSDDLAEFGSAMAIVANSYLGLSFMKVCSLATTLN